MEHRLSTISVALAAFTILASQVLSYRRGADDQQTFQWIARSYQVIQDLQSVQTGMVRAQAALRDYAPERDARAAQTFSDSLALAHSGFLEAQTLTWEDPVQHARLHALAPMLAERTSRLGTAYEQRVAELSFTRDFDDAIGAAIRSEQRQLVQRVRESEAAYARVRAIALYTGSLALLIMLLVFLLLRRHGEQLTRRALIDELTGLYNRRGFTWMAEHRMRLADRHGQPLHLMFIDLNDMKQINDRLGHDAGDAALVQTARLLEAVFRESDVVARLGGDEFVVLAEASVAADLNLHDRIHHALHDRRLPFSLSVGFALYAPHSTTSLLQLLQQADAAMYRAKRRAKSTREATALALSKETQS